MHPTIIDIHSHPQMKAYAHSFNESHNGVNPHSNSFEDKNSAWFSIWPSGEDIQKHLENIFGFTCFTQADYRTCLDGGVQLTFSSLYPIEKGFLSPFRNTGACADRILDNITGFGTGRINFVQDLKDYFPDLENEYQFQLALDGEIVRIAGKKYRYKFVNNFQDLVHLLQNNPADVKTMAIINTIEGAHSLGTGIQPYSLEQNISNIIDRINKIKTEWEFPPFFMTLAHHFYNEICGHAKSLGLAGFPLNQKTGLAAGFTPEGIEIVHELLDDSSGKRILIDVKHMSLPARKQFYQIIESDYNSSIPIIFSHGGVSGKYDIHKKSGITPNPADKFNSGKINIYDFEVEIIGASQGLIGIQLDERRIASKEALKSIPKNNTPDWPLWAAGLIWEQIRHIALVLDRNGQFAWGIQCIGSDFDGIVNPINGFYTAAHFKNLRPLLLIHAQAFIQKEAFQLEVGENFISPEEIVDRFLYQNAWSFLEKHFSSKTIKTGQEPILNR